ncbi:MAG: site-specific integrase [Firmicutes bacterium]|nr:site-specific integrase [Bacillota bacterium]
MATYRKRVSKRNDGRVKYLVQTTVVDEFGKRKMQSITWHNPKKLVGTAAKNAAVEFGQVWERRLRAGDVEPEKELKPLKFAQVADEWYKAREHKFSESYKQTAANAIKRLNETFGNRLMVGIKARDVIQYFVGLNNHQYQSTTARVKPESKERLNEAVLKYGVRKIRNESIAHPTLFNARKGETIRWNSAEQICETLGLPVNEIFEKIATEKPYKKETIMQYKRVLSPIFNYAIQNEVVTINYASSAYLKKVIGGEETAEVMILSNDEHDRLLDTLGKHSVTETLPIYLMMMLGLRTAEVCGLEFKDIDFDKEEIRIVRNRVYIPKKGLLRTDLKTKKSRRDLPICSLLVEKLKEYKAYHDALRDADPEFDLSDAVHCNYMGNPANPERINRALKQFLVEANCPPITAHKLRHGFITRLIDEGVSIIIVSRLAGHATVEMTSDVYSHYRKSSDNSREYLEKIFTKPVKNAESDKQAEHDKEIESEPK